MNDFEWHTIYDNDKNVVRVYIFVNCVAKMLYSKLN